MDPETTSIFSRREKFAAVCLFLTCTLVSLLTIVLIIAIAQTYKFNGALQEARDVARKITNQYGWLLGSDDETFNETLVM